MLHYAETPHINTNVSPSKETAFSTSPPDVDTHVSFYEIQAIFQQWKTLTLDLTERFAVLVGETKEADRKRRKPNLQLRLFFFLLAARAYHRRRALRKGGFPFRVPWSGCRLWSCFSCQEKRKKVRGETTQAPRRIAAA
jgi:hypothetical protein